MKTDNYKEDSSLFNSDGKAPQKHHPNLQKSRRAGVLMHITSLPGKYYSGDFGSEAFSFIRFLKDSGHSVWQVLPFTPTSAQTEWSPYSSPSAFAGNILFISPENLGKLSLISPDVLKAVETRPTKEANFPKALTLRLQLTQTAYDVFAKHQNAETKCHFNLFCRKEQYWLHDYALFIRLKQQFNNCPWNQWPTEYKDRHPVTLKLFAEDHHKELELEKFRQYLLGIQWEALKKQANQQGIDIIGDIPIYCSYDSADVWAHPHLFKLKADKSMQVVAGVPPDYFSKTGQLWNMPVYRWENHKTENFEWWLHRIRKNLEWFDIARLDHFRGFVSGWEVPAKASTAVNGRWEDGPGHSFFIRLKELYPNMPFIAEDLGDVDDKVYRLRDQFDLPGMEVLQFAFGDDMPHSVHIPHNHKPNNVVYTGTHDNNTLKGWYCTEINKSTKKRIIRYVGHRIKNKNIHLFFIRMAWASPSRLAIITIQDLLGKKSNSRMNRPATEKNNWKWRLKSMKKLDNLRKKIKNLLEVYGRS
ncbi:4-alpha-glucanotransferase [Thermophagus sp. OGC60D27]|uniref:4-alpha-glucanotransferase n=1 Tax=Thermophagus sp. OGC60D27 TaxID=3458415 RepID=UPI0040376D39